MQTPTRLSSPTGSTSFVPLEGDLPLIQRGKNMNEVVFGGLTFVKGEKVQAYYSMHKFGGNKSRYLKVAKGHGTHLPCFGLSEGWIEATIIEIIEVGKVTLRFSGPFCDPSYGMEEGFQFNFYESDQEHRLRKLDCPTNVSASVLVVRWHDWWSSGKWSDYYIACQIPMKMFTEELLNIEPDAETYTLFLRTSEDADKFAEASLGHVMKGRHRAAMYYLWPTQKYNASENAAYCEERSFFGLMQRVEAVGVPSRYPAPANLYRVLCGKQMYTTMCLQKDYKVPVTVRVQASEFINDQDSVVDNTLDAINELRKKLYSKKATESGVVKLGFSWMGCDVYRYEGRADLKKKLQKILSSKKQIPTTCMAQDLVEDRIAELRIHVFPTSERGFHKEIVYMLLSEDDSEDTTVDFQMTGAKSISSEQALMDLWHGNAVAQKKAEDQAKKLTDLWMLWYKTEWTAPRCPANGRFDFHLCWNGVNDPELWTCEVTECGASLCGLNIDARNISIVNSIFGDKRCDLEQCTCKKMKPLGPVRYPKVAHASWKTSSPTPSASSPTPAASSPTPAASPARFMSPPTKEFL